MNNQITKGKELIVYSEPLPQPANSTTDKLKKLLDNLKNYYQKLVNQPTVQKIIVFAEKYGTWLILVLIILITLGLLFWPQHLTWLTKLIGKLTIVFQTFIVALLAIFAGGLVRSLLESKGQVMADQTAQFLDFCLKSNGMAFFGAVGSGKTAILAMLAHHSPIENKYATFPCSLPWAKRYQISFDMAPDKPLGIREDIFIDETNLLFKGNVVQDVREKQRFLMHFMALSRQHGVRVFVNGQRLGHFSIEQREITTAVCEVSLVETTDEGIYVACEIWQSSGWTNKKTERNFTIFIPLKYLKTYDSYWLRSLKYLRDHQNYI